MKQYINLYNKAMPILLSKSVCIGLIILSLLLQGSCKNFVQIDNLTDKLLAEQVFESDGTANVAITGIYRLQRDRFLLPFTLFNSMISDDLIPYTNSTTSIYVTNQLLSSDTSLPWGVLYSTIYATNNAIEKLQQSSGISETARQYYIAEAKFNRAFCYFYLVNWYGDVPLVLTTDVKTNSLIARSPTEQVYAQIVTDLKDAQAALGNDYSYTGGERTRANKWVATALLARIYLYQKDYENAGKLAADVINSEQYHLLEGPTGIFNKNNSEAILQWANSATESIGVASNFIYTATPTYICSNFLLEAFETGDLRKTNWIKTQAYSGQPVSIPFKLTTAAAIPPEYYTVIRLAEMYLIRAEAHAMQGDFHGCADDVNLIRQKHGGLNTPLAAPTNEEAALDMLLKERQVDLFTEGCHRWFDLKRTGRIDAVMMAEKPTTWQSTAALYPLPLTEMQRNPSLVQNPGYE